MNQLILKNSCCGRGLQSFFTFIFNHLTKVEVDYSSQFSGSLITRLLEGFLSFLGSGEDHSFSLVAETIVSICARLFYPEFRLNQI